MATRRRNPRLRGREMRGRHQRRKVSVLTEQKVTYVDYKDVELLKSFVSERAKIRSQRVSGNSRQQQREVAAAIKNAREMALLAYVRRPVTQRRTSRRRDPSRPTQPWDPSSPAMPPPAGARVGGDDDVNADELVVDEAFADEVLADEVLADDVLDGEALVDGPADDEPAAVDATDSFDEPADDDLADDKPEANQS